MSPRCVDQAANYTLSSDRTPEFVGFLERLLSPNVETRYSAKQALKDPWLASVADQAIWDYLLERELKSYEHSTNPVQPANYTDFAAWREQVQRLIGEEPVEEGDPDEEDNW